MPVLAPVLRVLKLLDGVAVGQAVNKAQRAQLLQPFGLGVRAIGPVPYKQANVMGVFRWQVMTGH